MPAAYTIRDFLQAAFGALPVGLTTRRLRANSALYDEEGLTWADEAGIQFAVSADMSESLTAKVQAIHDYEWKPYTSLDPRASQDEERQWAEVVTRCGAVHPSLDTQQQEGDGALPHHRHPRAVSPARPAHR